MPQLNLRREPLDEKRHRCPACLNPGTLISPRSGVWSCDDARCRVQTFFPV